jgi:hypothetical protein
MSETGGNYSEFAMIELQHLGARELERVSGRSCGKSVKPPYRNTSFAHVVFYARLMRSYSGLRSQRCAAPLTRSGRNN